MKPQSIVFAVLAVTIAAACSSGGDETQPELDGDSASETTRSAEAGGVTVDATWLTAGDEAASTPEFQEYPLDRFVLIEITFTTHSGDLRTIEMEGASSLTQGTSVLRPQAWVETSDDSHHRAGVLVFPGELGEGAVELALDLGEDALSLRWERPPA